MKENRIKKMEEEFQRHRDRLKTPCGGYVPPHMRGWYVPPHMRMRAL